jgi:hypothetical protein
MNTPILFLIFNRPNETSEVFNALKIIKPKFLYVACDGPRKSVENDIENVVKTREILDQIDWDCKLKTLYRDTNLGCKTAVSTAISWFFKNVEEGIILEDDCIPDSSFFDYCSELLEYYRSDSRIMHISGLNFLSGPKDLLPSEKSYHFSKYAAVWGWATWRRAWQLYDVDILNWPKAKEEKLHYNFCFNKREVVVWEDRFDTAYNHEIDTWDYQWAYCIFMNNGICVTPNTNLITNIGFNDNATHTFVRDNRSYLAQGTIDFPLTHTLRVVPDYNSDLVEFVAHINVPFYKRILKKVLNILGCYTLVASLYHKFLKFER